LRFANIYGPRQEAGLEGGVVAIFLERLARGEETTIYGDGSQSRDFIYVDDVIAALLATVGKNGGPYNVGTGAGTTVAKLHDACANIAGVNAPPRFEDARLGDVQRSVLDVALIERELGWRARVPLDDGLRRTWAWMKDQSQT
jgi:UDP-glucose 4-epimerase